MRVRVNRPDSGGLAAPSAHDWQEIEVFVALAEGAYRYVHRRHALQPVAGGDLRPAMGVQQFVGNAPLKLVYAADFAKMIDASAEDRTFCAAADAGFVAQNVYLYCAATVLARVVRGLVDRRKLAAPIKLTVDQRIVLIQMVGFPPETAAGPRIWPSGAPISQTGGHGDFRLPNVEIAPNRRRDHRPMVLPANSRRRSEADMARLSPATRRQSNS